LNVSDDSGNLGPAQAVILSGTGTGPAISVTPTSLSFPSQVVGTSSSARSVTVKSMGTGPLQVSSVTATAPFSQTNNCNGSLSPGTSCTIQVTFSPTIAGAASGSLTIGGNAGTQTVNLSGNGIAPVTLSTSSLAFYTVAIGNTSSVRSVTLTNQQKIPLTFAGINASAPFAIASNTCGGGIAAGAKCTVGLTFSPAALGAVTGTLIFTDDAGNSPQAVNLTGTGGTPVTLSAASLNFGRVTVGTTSSPRTVTLTNRQNVALTFSSIAATAGFAVASNTCGASIAVGANCTVGVTFSPSVAGAATGTLTFTDSAANSPQVVNLSGTGQ
jgi:hypothetical protein